MKATSQTNGYHLSQQDFATLRRAAKDTFGIDIHSNKHSLAEGRLKKVARKTGVSMSSLVQSLSDGKDTATMSAVVDALTTNHTFFGREHEHFEYLLQTALPSMHSSMVDRRKDLRLWCAAAATGEEPYYLAMMIKRYLGQDYRSWQAGLLATDISEEALTTARAGIYSPERVASLQEAFRSKNFNQLPDGRFQVKESVRSEITYRRFNLTAERYPFKRPFDVVFCRNVMIYFDATVTDFVVQRLYESLQPGGYLFIGMTESLGREDRRFRYIDTGIYQRS